MSILLQDATYIDYQTLKFNRNDIVVAPGRVEFHPPKTVSPQNHQTISCSGKLVTRSFAIGHHHAYSALARGMNPPEKNPENFFEILQYIWWTLDKCLTKEMVELSGLTTAIACAKAGTTFIIDHHASPCAITGSLDILAKAFEKVRLSHLLCYEISDRDGRKKAEEGLEETDSYLAKQPGLIGLHASFTLSDRTLNRAAELIRKHQTGIHIHVAEDPFDQNHCKENYRITVVERLKRFGLLDSSKSILAHCLHLSDAERLTIADSPCWVVQNTDSNLNNNVGYFSSQNLGEHIMLGTDGMHSNMLRSMQAAYFVGQRYDPLSPIEAYNRLRNVHRYIKQAEIQGDGPDNLLILDYDSPTPVTEQNIAAHFVYGLNQTHIRDVIANGRLIVRNRTVLGVDEELILSESKKLARKLWNCMAR